MNKSGKSAIKLSELNQEVQSVIYSNFPDNVWVIAEISEIKVNASGHCYLELIEKDEESDKLRAKARAVIWAYSYRMLKPYFETSTGYELVPGIKVLVYAKVEFHEIYGYSLNITDIDPAYTLGDLERKRLEIITKLEKEGVFHMNKELPLPLVPQKIAIISSETAAGYGDFIDQLEQNPYGYKFYHRIFPSIMQGDQAERSIIQSLERIYQYDHLFDVVVIIRGGGSRSDLSCFDNYQIAYHVTQFSLPVITGIGHEQDDTITDLVAHTRLKTPTAVAEFLVNRIHDFENSIIHLNELLIHSVNSILNGKNTHLEILRQKIISLTTAFIQQNKSQFRYNLRNTTESIKTKIISEKQNIQLLIHSLFSKTKHYTRFKNLAFKNYFDSLQTFIKKYLDFKQNQIESFGKLNRHLDPRKMLNLGYSITRHKGTVLKHSSDVNTGDEIETWLKSGQLSSIIKTQKKGKEDNLPDSL